MTNTSSFSYFSFVTLTTVGFGDIAPVSKGAKLLVILEAILGQLYIAIFLARIIASYQGRKRPSLRISASASSCLLPPMSGKMPGRKRLTNPANMISLAALVDGRQPRQILTLKRR